MPVDPDGRVLAPPLAQEVEEYLADLPGLYDAAEPATQKRMLQALFERIEVLGSNRVWLVPSTEAEERGLGLLFTGEFRAKVRQTGRGERSSRFTIQVSVRIEPSVVHRPSAKSA